MATITQILDKVYPKLRKIEENPSVTVFRVNDTISSNPFQGQANAVYSISFETPCLYSEQPEIIRSGSNISTEQQMYLYFKRNDLIANEPINANRDVGIISKKDRFSFKGKRYIPVEIQELFGMWKVKVSKE